MVEKPKFLTIIFSIILLLSTASFAIVAVSAQSDATVTVLASDGGATSITGTNTYPDGTDFTISATPATSTTAFLEWIITTNTGSSNYFDNPLTITVVGGVTYTIQATFQTIQPLPGRDLPPDLSNSAIIVVLAAAGGTSTPAPGTYALADATSMTLTATPNSGWQFAHWTICGTNMDHGGAPVDYTPTDNPYTVGHGYGYTYYYQPVFTQVGSNEPTPTPTSIVNAGGMSTETWIIIGLVIVIIIMLIGFGMVLRRKH